MLWICLVFGGAVLGYSLSYDEWEGMFIGAAMGWLLWSGVRLYLLDKRSSEQSRELFVALQTVQSMQQRLTLLEYPPVSSIQTSTERQPEPQEAAPLPAEPVVSPAQIKKPELIWNLPLHEEPDAPTAKPVQAATPHKASTTPATPQFLQTSLSRALEWLTGGNTVLRVGVVVLFLGLAFLLRYATEGMVVPIEVRYAGVAASALGLLGLGWWLRLRNASYALMLQGAGIGVLYLTVFAAMKLHALLDPTLGFALLVAITAFSAILALTQNSLALACAGALGGFAAPILASTGQGSHVSLFSYFALLNAGIFAIAWFRAWRILNLIGFFGTFGIGFAWGIRAYTPELLWSTEPFLILFFLMYLAIGLLFARRKLQEQTSGPQDDSRGALLRWSAQQGDYVDGTLLFGTPIVGFGLQYALVEHIELGAAFSALALGLVYMGLARVLSARGSERTTLLMETCLALGVVFATLATPLGLGSQWTTCAWAVEGAAIFWLGMHQHRVLARAFGLFLQLAAGITLLKTLDPAYVSLVPHGDYWTSMVLAIAAFVSAWCVHHHKVLKVMDPEMTRSLLIVWAAAWWTFSLHSVVQLFVPVPLQITALLLAAAASVALWTVLALRLRWPDLATLCTVLTPLCSFLLLGSLGDLYHPAQNVGWAAWLAVFAVHLLSLRRLDEMLHGLAVRMAHVVGCWLIIAVLALELRFGLMQLSEHYNAWRWLGWAVVPSLYLWAITSQRQAPWPVSDYANSYRIIAAAPMALLMLAWFWLANFFSDGAADPLPYVPLLNPLEIGLMFSLAGVFLWMRHYLPKMGLDEARVRNIPPLVAGASLFALVTAMVMRTAHHWADVPWHTEDLLASMRVQAGLSIVWTLMALALMIGGHMRANRQIWLGGAALIGVVVIKLFFIELSNRGGMERIVSFIGVGILLLVVGYFAPLPPKLPASKTDKEPGTAPAAEPTSP